MAQQLVWIPLYSSSTRGTPLIPTYGDIIIGMDAIKDAAHIGFETVADVLSALVRDDAHADDGRRRSRYDGRIVN